MKRLIPILLLISLGLTGCGNYNPVAVVQFLTEASKADSGGSDDNSHSGGAGSGPVNTPPAVPPSFVPPPVQLQSITVNPTSASIPAGRSQEYSAEGTYSDGTTRDITSEAQWSIEAPTQIASFSWSGRGWNQANGQFPGTGTVMATLDGVTGEASLSVREAERIGLSVFPTIQEIGIGSIQDFVPQGPFTDGLVRYSFPIDCHLSDTTVAMLIEVGGSYCRVEGLSAGTAILTLSSGEFSVEATVNVLPLIPFDHHLSLVGPRQEIAIDETGGKIVVLKASIDRMTGAFDLFWSRRDQGGSWSPQQPIGVGPVGRDDTFAMDMALDGSILLVGTHSEGIYSVRYLPGQGWQGIETVSTRPLSPVNDFSLYRLQVGYDAGGNGIAVWTDDEKVFSSEYHAGLGWSIPIMREDGSAPVLAMNESGKAILVWQKRTGTLPRAGFTIYMYTPYASAYTAESGWSVPVVLDTFEFAHQPAVFINESGEGVAVWGRFQQSYEVMTARLTADGSWTPAEVLIGGIGNHYCSLGAVDRSGNALLLCKLSLSTSSLKAYHYLVGSGWQTPIDLEDGSPWQMKMDQSGNALVTLVGDSSIKMQRYDRIRGWQPIETLDVPREGFMYPWLAMNSGGEPIVFWNAYFHLWNTEEKRFEFYYETYIHSLP